MQEREEERRRLLFFPVSAALLFRAHFSLRGSQTRAKAAELSKPAAEEERGNAGEKRDEKSEEEADE